MLSSDRSTGSLQMRNPEHFPEMLKYTLDQLTINETPKVVGSSVYKMHRYPSDVDVFESVDYKTNGGQMNNMCSTHIKSPRERALDFYTSQFQNIAQRLLMQKEIQFNDFKAGMDDRFDIDIPEQSTECDRQKMAYDLAMKYNLCKEEAINIFESASDLATFKALIKELKTIRWNLVEIIKGCKTLIGGRVVTLREALEMNALVKLDTIVWISGRFQSVEVFYNLRYSEGGSTYEFHPLNNYVQGLLEDIEKYSDGDNYSPLKVLKRMWFLSKVVDCKDMLEAITPILGSDAAALNQLSGDIEVLMDLLKNPELTHQQLEKIFVETLTFDKRGFNHLDGSVLDKYQLIIKEVFPLYLSQMCEESKKMELAKILKLLHDLLKPVINETSSYFLNKVNSMNITCMNPRFFDAEELPVRSPYSQI